MTFVCIGVIAASGCDTMCLIQESDYCMLRILESHGVDGNPFDQVTAY